MKTNIKPITFQRRNKRPQASQKRPLEDVSDPAPAPSGKREAEFLKNLPSYDRANFSTFQPNDPLIPKNKSLPVYLSTESNPNSIRIVAEKFVFPILNVEISDFYWGIATEYVGHPRRPGI